MPTQRAPHELNERLQALIEQGQHQEAYRLILERHGPGLRGYLRAAAGDAAQGDELYAALREALWQHLPGLKLGPRGDGGETGSIRAWLYRSARNRVIDWRQRYSRDHVRPMATGQEFQLRAPGPATLLERKEEAEQVQRLLMELSEEERDALILHYERDLSFREVGEVLGISEGAAKQACHRARQRLRDLVRGEA